MSLLFDGNQPGIGFVLHPTDLSQASERAFNHALAIAIRSGSSFTLLHAVGRRATDNWIEFPSVSTRLAQWKSAGSTAGIEKAMRQASVSKVEVDIRDPVAASKKYLKTHAVDMLVLAISGRTGISRLLRPSRAEKLARQTKLLTLFVPEGARDFVRPRSGEVTLRRILIPVDPSTDPRPAMNQAVHAAALLDNPSLEITLLHVGEGDRRMEDLPDLPFCRWHMLERRGDVVETIMETGEEIGADAIYMSTAWSRASIGRVSGGVTEAVLSLARCPVVTVPID